MSSEIIDSTRAIVLIDSIKPRNTPSFILLTRLPMLSNPTSTQVSLIPFHNHT